MVKVESLLYYIIYYIHYYVWYCNFIFNGDTDLVKLFIHSHMQ